MKQICPICKSAQFTQLQAKEMMLGLRTKFTYAACVSCNALRLVHPPKNLNTYYPPEYYSFDTKSPSIILARMTYWLMRGLARPFAQWLFSWMPEYRFPYYLPWWTNSSTRVLDVGCGNDTALAYFKANGIHSLLGIDPFISKTHTSQHGIELRKQSIRDTKGKWDIIIVNHVLEHESNSQQFLRHVKRLLAPGGICIVGTPIVPNYAFKKYNADWVQLDPPRHLFIHSHTSIGLCANQADLRIDRIVYDSSPFQFWGSENYIHNISLKDNPYRIVSFHPVIFAKLIYWRVLSRVLNLRRQGDSVVLYLSSSDDGPGSL